MQILSISEIKIVENEMRIFKYIFSVLSLFLCFSCQVSTKALFDGRGGRSAYNISIQNTNSQEMLLNLVRLRYFDLPLFLEVGNITTQYTYRSKADTILPIPGFNNTNPGSLGGEVSWQNQPTIQYTPLEGQAFATQLMQPIDLSTIQQIIYAGWDIDRVFKLTIERVNQFANSPAGSLPAPIFSMKYKPFYEVTALLRRLQEKGVLEVGLNVYEHDDANNKKEYLQLVFPTSEPESQKIASLFENVIKIDDRYVLNLLFGYNLEGKIGIMPRSLLSCLYYLSQGVRVPKSDIINHIVEEPQLKNGEREEFLQALSALMKIKSSFSKPKLAFVAIEYRNRWFYIDDCDLNSKRSFLLLQQLYNLQAREQKQAPPLLTLPIGG